MKQTFFEYRKKIFAAKPQLITFKKQDDRDKFEDLMKILLPEIQEYVRSWLTKAEHDGQIEKGRYRVDDFMGELYIATFDHIETIKEDRRLYIWMLAKINQILEDKIADDDFDATYFPSLTKYVELENEAMDEKLSINADGEIVLEDSFLDDNTEDYEYKIEDIFASHEDSEIIDKINNRISAERIDQIIKHAMESFSLNEKMIIDLNIKHGLALAEIEDVVQVNSEVIVALMEKFRLDLEKYSYA